MTAPAIAVRLLLACGVGVVLLCAVGLLVLRDEFDRLHALGPATLLGPALIAAAVLIEGPDTQSRFKAVLTAAVLVVVGPVLAHATARAARFRRHGAPESLPDGRGREASS